MSPDTTGSDAPAPEQTATPSTTTSSASASSPEASTSSDCPVCNRRLIDGSCGYCGFKQ